MILPPARNPPRERARPNPFMMDVVQTLDSSAGSVQNLLSVYLIEEVKEESRWGS
jgi:hypothetical protein